MKGKGKISNTSYVISYFEFVVIEKPQLFKHSYDKLKKLFLEYVSCDGCINQLHDQSYLFTFRRLECLAVHDLLLTSQELEKALNENLWSPISRMKPTFFLIGSVAEGTRLYCGSEVDLSAKFEGLHPFLVDEVTGTSLLVDDNDREILRQFITDSNMFNYSKFLEFFLKEVNSALKLLVKEKRLPATLNLSFDHQPCPLCIELNDAQQKRSIFEPYTHCDQCHPAVCHTKIGPCILSTWNFAGISRTMVVDLVPVFEVKGQSLPLFNNVMRTLINDTPPGWKDYLESIYKQDIILPEAFATQKGDRKKVKVTCKLLSYGNQYNYVVRPAQVTSTSANC